MGTVVAYLFLIFLALTYIVAGTLF